MTMTLYSMLVAVSTMFLWLKHPMSMGFILVLQTMIIAMISGMMLNNYFFSYIIMIIMLSGALVLFIYMASVASNEKFKTPIKMMITFTMILMITLMLTKNMEVLEFPKNNNSMYGTISLMKLFNSMSAYMTMIMILYLLMTMIIVSFIASNKEGPLRMKIYEQTDTKNSPLI
uniref:NADH dehydrogenase subunit 6 n=1 Tax=Hyperoncus lateritius TaxID=2080394 RepID=A0A2P1CMM9_9HEMI|nr:NADH dehydrogenase subunit 6 [Hyperoncus lateritius]